MTHQETGICVRCGIETDHRFGGEFVCAECIEIRGSCCPEFGADDLTSQNQEVEQEEPALKPERREPPGAT